MNKARIAIRSCSIDAPAESVDAAVRAAVAGIGGVPQRVQDARSIVVKPNWVGLLIAASPDAVKIHCGRHVNSTNPEVTEAVVKLLRESNPRAEIYLAEGLDTFHSWVRPAAWEFMRARDLERRYGVKLIDSNSGNHVEVPVPGGGVIRKRLWVREEIAGADAFVSVAKLKCHETAGVTLSTKNMFGLLPAPKYGKHNRGYMHHNAFRLIRTFVDVNTSFRQSLSVIDGVVGANFGMGTKSFPYETQLVLAGKNHVALDAVAMRVMGFDPFAEFPDAPFMISENLLGLCERAGLGSRDPSNYEIDGPEPDSFGYRFETRPESEYKSEKAAEIIAGAKAGAADYQRMLPHLLQTHRGKFVLVSGGRVVATAADIAEAQERLREAGLGSDVFGFTAQVLPVEVQPENIAAYLT